MSNAHMSARVGLFFLLGVALIWVTFESLDKGRLDKKGGYTLVAHFDNLKELKVGDEVRMAGVRVGQVAETRLHNRRAQAVLQIQPHAQIAEDATATIAMAGLLGSNYVSIDLGSDRAGFLSPGSEVRTVNTPDLNTVVSQLGDIGQKVDQALSQFAGAMGGQDGEGLIGKIDRLIEDNREKIADITSNLRDISAKINQGEGTLGKLVNDPAAYDSLLATLEEIRGAADEAKRFVSNAQGIVDQVKEGKGTLGTLIYDETAGNDIKAVAKNLRELSDKLNQGEGTLGKLINDDSLFRQAQDALRKVDRAVDGLSDQGPITAVGVAANALF